MFIVLCFTREKLNMEKTNLVIIANPCAGKGKARRIAPKVASVLAQANYCVTLKFTQAKGDAREFAKSDDFDVVVVVGGDGTLNEVVSGLIEGGRVDVSLGYIPMGRTNDFARSLKIPRKWKKSLKIILNRNEEYIDICKFNENYFAYVAAYGIFAETSCSVNQKAKNLFGYLAYLIRGAREVFRKNNYHIKLEVDGRVIDDYYALLGFGNTRSLGGIVKFKDSVVEMGDGLFEILLVKNPKSIWQLSRMINRFARSDWQGDGLEMIHANKAKVYIENEMLWSLDGEKHIITEDIEIKNLHNAVRLIVGK